MVFDINTFRNQGLPQGGARPSLFDVFFPPITNVNTDIGQDLLVRCSAASIPQSRLSTIDVYYMGRPIKIVGERSFVPWTIRCYNEIDFTVRDFFEAWSNLANTLVGNQAQFTDNIMNSPSGSGSNGGGYKVDGVIVNQYSKDFTLTRAYVFYGMYPEIVGDIELNWEQANRIETFDVQLAYDFWVPAGGDFAGGAAGDVAVPPSYSVEIDTGASITTAPFEGQPSAPPVLASVNNGSTSQVPGVIIPT